MLFIIILFSSSLVSCKQTNEKLLDKALRLFSEKRYEEAVKIYSQIIGRNSKIQIAYYNRGQCFLNLKNYTKALSDFNEVMSLQTIGDLIINYNKNLPFSNEEVGMQVPYNDALYQRAQTKFFMDSLKSSFSDFQILVDNNYSEKSNCLLWQGTIYIKNDKKEKGCDYFTRAGQFADTEDDKSEANKMLQTYCSQAGVTNSD